MQESQAIVDFLQDRARDVAVQSPRPPSGPPVAAQRQALEEGERVADRELDDVAQAPAADQHREALRTQPPAAARRARLLDHVFLELRAHAV